MLTYRCSPPPAQHPCRHFRCRASQHPTATCCASTAASVTAPATRMSRRPLRWPAASCAAVGCGETARAACPRTTPACCSAQFGAALQGSRLRWRPAVQLPVPLQPEPLRRSGPSLYPAGQPPPRKAVGCPVRTHPVLCWAERLALGYPTACLARSLTPFAEPSQHPGLVPPACERPARLALAAAECAKRWLRLWIRLEQRLRQQGTPAGAATAQSAAPLGRETPLMELRGCFDVWQRLRPARPLSPAARQVSAWFMQTGDQQTSK